MREISIDEVKKSIDEHSDVFIVDVRTQPEYEKGHIQGSILASVDTLEDVIENLIPDKSKTVYMYCLSGARSTQAVVMLEALGYTNAYSMTSGLLGWRVKGFSLVTE